jgi:hypothetical protein
MENNLAVDEVMTPKIAFWSRLTITSNIQAISGIDGYITSFLRKLLKEIPCIKLREIAYMEFQWLEMDRVAVLSVNSITVQILRFYDILDRGRF